MIFNEIECHVNTSLGLVRGMHPLHPPLCPRLHAKGKHVINLQLFYVTDGKH